MTTRLFHSTLAAAVAAVALALLCAAPALAAAQAVAYGEPPPARGAAPLPAAYRVRLESAWPQLGDGTGCVNGGGETVEGVLRRTGGGEYAGIFTRRTHLRFCGVHGASGAGCSLALDGEGAVAARAVVVPDGRAPEGRALRVAWTPGVGHAAAVSGACDGAFKERVREMYLSVRHGLEFALPEAGAAPRGERLEDYPWIVEVE